MSTSELLAGSGRSELLHSLRQELRLRHYSDRTSHSYCAWVSRYIRFHGTRHTAELNRVHVVEFLSALASRYNVSASTQNQALAAISFLYRDILRLPIEDAEKIRRAKRPVRLPVVLTQSEIKRVMTEMEETPRLVAMVLYGSGLRLLECLQLRVRISILRPVR